MRYIHISAGMLALIAGAVALYAAKGSTLHRRFGLAFVAAMLVMTTSAVILAAFGRPNIGNVVAGTLTFYLVTSALITVRKDVAHTRALTVGLMLFAAGVSVLGFTLAGHALRVGIGIDGIPAVAIGMFAIVGALAVLGDLRMLRAGTIEGPPRIARHLWRMTLAMWIATSSFFLGQAKFFPQGVRASGVLAIPPLLVMALLVYWMIKVRRGRARARPAPPAPTPDSPCEMVA